MAEYDPPMRTERGRGRRAAALLLALLALAAAAGCGEKGNPAAHDEKQHDVEVLNVAITQELTLVDAYRLVESKLADPRLQAVMRRYTAQELEHVDALTKSMRGLGGTVEAEAEALDDEGLKTGRDYLLFAYEQTSAQLTHFLEDVNQLATASPRSFAASIAANMAQHLVVLRQALGASLLEAVPESFDTGEVPPPEPPPPGAPPPGGR